MENNIVNEYGVFTPNEKTNQTAEEVYQEYLKNLNEVQIPKIDEHEILMSKLMLENANIKQELASINTKLLDIQNTKGGI